MRTIATNVPVVSCVCQSVRTSDCNASVPCKTAERIEHLFGVKTLCCPRNIVVDVGGRDHPTAKEGRFDAAFAKKHLFPLISLAMLQCLADTRPSYFPLLLIRSLGQSERGRHAPAPELCRG